MPFFYLGGDIVQRAAIVSHMRGPSRLERIRRSLCKLTAAESPKERPDSRTSDLIEQQPIYQVPSPSTWRFPPKVLLLKHHLAGLQRNPQHQRILGAAYLVEIHVLRPIYTSRPHRVLAIACCSYLVQVPEPTANI